MTAQQLDRDLAEVADSLLKAFPRYAELAAPEPIGVEEVQQLLGEEEALVSFFMLDDRLLVWLVRPGRAPVYRDVELKKADLARIVSSVRASLDQRRNQDLASGRLAPFDVAGAHKLYLLLLAPLITLPAGPSGTPF